MEISWKTSAVKDLKFVHQFYLAKSKSAADKIVRTILSSVEEIQFTKQYQVDDILGEPYRRIVVYHCKVIYQPNKKGIVVLRIFDTRQNPKSQRV
ncbi:MAG: type II toxin-antitoxin system RelE/ParE family toxin [Bacteroidia bacterium]